MSTPFDGAKSAWRTADRTVRLAVHDFGPIAKGEVDLRPLTVFVGPSNTGKTYLAILIYALHRLSGGFWRLPLAHSPLLSSTWMKHRHVSPLDAVSVAAHDTDDTLDKMNIDGRDFRFLDLPKSVREVMQGLLRDDRFLGDDLAAELSRCFDLASVSELRRWTAGDETKASIRLEVGETDSDLWRFSFQTAKSGIEVDGNIEDVILFPGNSADLQIARQFGQEMQANRSQTARGFAALLGLATDPGTSKSGSMAHYLPATRTGIMQTHGVIASGAVARSTRIGLQQWVDVPMLSGILGDFMQALILGDQFRVDRLWGNEMDVLARTLEREILAGEIKADRGSPYPEFVYSPRTPEGESETAHEVGLARASSMVSELAPVVLFLRDVVDRGDTLIIEEPEAHLHPAAQAKVAMLLARLVRAGVRVIVTTHSDWLLQEIGNLIREGALQEQATEPAIEGDHSCALPPSDVGVWLFRGNGASGSTVEEIAFDSVEGVEPSDYEDVAEALYNRSADLQNRLDEVAGGFSK